MKKRTGFVSNSSSSSFVVVLPKSVSEIFKDIDMEKVHSFLSEFNEYEESEDGILLADLIRVLVDFEKEKFYYDDDDDYYEYNREDTLPRPKSRLTKEFFRNVLPDCIVTQIDTSSERGSIELLEKETIEKIYKMMQ